MHNKSLLQKNKYSYLSAFEEGPVSALERSNYNRAIDQLNSENVYLSRNIHELIIENLNLKNKIYHAWDSISTTKQNGKHDVAEQIKRLEGQSRSPTDRKRPQKFTVWSQKQQANEASNMERYNSPGGSDPKRQTIIGELSESHFQSMDQVSNSRREKRGIFISKKLETKEKPAEKMVKSLQNKKVKYQETQVKNKQTKKIEEEEASQTSRIVINIDELNKANPEIDSPNTTQQKGKHKKDNSPYLINNSRIKTETALNHTPASPSQFRAKNGHLASSIREKYSNTANLTPKVYQHFVSTYSRIPYLDHQIFNIRQSSKKFEQQVSKRANFAKDNFYRINVMAEQLEESFNQFQRGRQGVIGEIKQLNSKKTKIYFERSNFQSSTFKRQEVDCSVSIEKTPQKFQRDNSTNNNSTFKRTDRRLGYS